MITGMRGKLTRLMENEARLSIAQLEYQVLIPEFVRRKLQDLVGTEISLCTEQYIEGGQGASHMVPRIIGFLTEHELGFFTLFCTVNKIGPKKALKALTQAPVEVAKAIARKDTAWLSKLPGIGKQTAENVVAQLHRSVGPFCVSESGQLDSDNRSAVPGGQSNLHNDAYNALMTLGLSSSEALERLDKVLAQNKDLKDLPSIIQAVFGRE